MGGTGHTLEEKVAALEEKVEAQQKTIDLLQSSMLPTVRLLEKHKVYFQVLGGISSISVLLLLSILNALLAHGL